MKTIHLQLLTSMSFCTMTEDRIAVKGGSDEPLDDGDEAEDDDAGGDEMDSFGMIGLPKQ